MASRGRAAAFPEFEVGAMPHVIRAGGDHRHAIRLRSRDLRPSLELRVGDICEADVIQHRTSFADLPSI